jgi:subtilase family serine protease
MENVRLKSKRRTIRRAVQVWLIATVALLALTAQLRGQSFATHHVQSEVASRRLPAIGRLPAQQIMNLDIVLPLSNPSGLNKRLRDIYNPASLYYRHFLTVPQFTEKFGPSQDHYDALVNFAKANGLEVTGGNRDRMEVQVKAPVSRVEAALHITMNTYQHPTEDRIFYSPDREPTTALPFQLWHVSGLDNYSIPRPLYVKKEDYARARGINPDKVVSYAIAGSGPAASYLGSDMRAAYYGGTSLTGSGQNLGIFSYGGTDLADVNKYYQNIGQTNTVPIFLVATDSVTSTQRCPTCNDIEQTLDITMALGMAPGLASLVVYVGSSDTAIISAMATRTPLTATNSCSWYFGPDQSALDPYFQRMAAQGQSFFAAAGDGGTWSATSSAWPAEDPWVTAVGGTDLITAGPAGAWVSETPWGQTGGGISPEKIAIPSWQQILGVISSSNQASSTYRNGPDVAANANYTFYYCSNEGCTRGHQCCGTDLGRLRRAGKPANGFRGRWHHRLHQSCHLCTEHNAELYSAVSRHRQRRCG